MKKLVVISVSILIAVWSVSLPIISTPIEAKADINMVAMKSNGGGEFIVWHPDGSVSLYVHKIDGEKQSLVKVKDLDPADHPLHSKIRPVEGVSGYENGQEK